LVSPMIFSWIFPDISGFTRSSDSTQSLEIIHKMILETELIIGFNLSQTM
jgi:hypothetical protein